MQKKNNRKAGKQNYSAESLMIRLVAGVVLIVIGVLFFLSALILNLHGIFDAFRNLARGLCGSFSFAVGVWPVWGGVLLILSSQRKVSIRLFGLAFAEFILLLTIFNLFSRRPGGLAFDAMLTENQRLGYFPADGYGVYIGRMYEISRTSGMAGGALGTLLGWLLWKAIGCIAGGILTILIIPAVGISLFGMDFTAVKNKLKGVAAARAQQREEDEQRRLQDQMEWQRRQEAISREKGYRPQQQQPQNYPGSGQQPAQNVPAAQPGPYAPGAGYGTVHTGSQAPQSYTGSVNPNSMARMPVKTGNTAGFAAMPGEQYTPASHEMYTEKIVTKAPAKQNFVSRLFPGKNRQNNADDRRNGQYGRQADRPASVHTDRTDVPQQEHRDYTGRNVPAVSTGRSETVQPERRDYTGRNVPVTSTGRSEAVQPERRDYTGRNVSVTSTGRSEAVQPERRDYTGRNVSVTSTGRSEAVQPERRDYTGRNVPVVNTGRSEAVQPERRDYTGRNASAGQTRSNVQPTAPQQPVSYPPVQQPAAARQESEENNYGVFNPRMQAVQSAAAKAQTPAQSVPERASNGLLKPKDSWSGDTDDARPPWEEAPEPVYADNSRIHVETVSDSTYQPDLHLPPRKNPAAEEPEPQIIEHPYVFPGMALLRAPQPPAEGTAYQDKERSLRLQETLESFKIPAKVRNVIHGPAISRFQLQIAQGIRVNKITDLDKNIAMNMAVKSVRIEAPIPGKSLVGIEVPNPKVSMVTLRQVLESPQMQSQEGKPLVVALGKDVAGTPITCDLARMPHLLIAGATGSGKSVCINTMINSLLYRTSPKEVRLILVDPKVVELQCYNGVPHLLIPVVSDPHKAAGALEWAVGEMMDRYHRFTEKGVRNIDGFNAALQDGEEAMPRIVIIIDELADLMMQCKKDVEERICRIAQLARACGIHLVVATQRPSVDVITGLIKANIPSRIAFKVSSGVDSRTILDRFGAETLLGHGDMLYQASGEFTPTRVQGCFLSDGEVNRITDFIRMNSPAVYDPAIQEQLDKVNAASDMPPADEYTGGETQDNTDDMLQRAIDMAIQDGQVSTSMLQRRFSIGYARAGRIVDEMERLKIISAKDGAKPRMCLITRQEYEERKSSGFLQQ